MASLQDPEEVRTMLRDRHKYATFARAKIDKLEAGRVALPAAAGAGDTGRRGVIQALVESQRPETKDSRRSSSRPQTAATSTADGDDEFAINFPKVDPSGESELERRARLAEEAALAPLREREERKQREAAEKARREKLAREAERQRERDLEMRKSMDTQEAFRAMRLRKAMLEAEDKKLEDDEKARVDRMHRERKRQQRLAREAQEAYEAELQDMIDREEAEFLRIEEMRRAAWEAEVRKILENEEEMRAAEDIERARVAAELERQRIEREALEKLQQGFKKVAKVTGDRLMCGHFRFRRGELVFEDGEDFKQQPEEKSAALKGSKASDEATISAKDAKDADASKEGAASKEGEASSQKDSAAISAVEPSASLADELPKRAPEPKRRMVLKMNTKPKDARVDALVAPPQYWVDAQDVESVDGSSVAEGSDAGLEDGTQPWSQQAGEEESQERQPDASMLPSVLPSIESVTGGDTATHDYTYDQYSQEQQQYSYDGEQQYSYDGEQLQVAQLEQQYSYDYSQVDGGYDAALTPQYSYDGSYDANGGYYDEAGNWVASISGEAGQQYVQSGYYDEAGSWVAYDGGGGDASQTYDQSGYYDEAGNWVGNEAQAADASYRESYEASYEQEHAPA